MTKSNVFVASPAKEMAETLRAQSTDGCGYQDLRG